jgi:hypothetical protein
MHNLAGAIQMSEEEEEEEEEEQQQQQQQQQVNIKYEAFTVTECIEVF